MEKYYLKENLGWQDSINHAAIKVVFTEFKNTPSVYSKSTLNF